MDENNLRIEGLNHIYLDEKQKLFSNVALGLLARAIGHSLKIAYFNEKKNVFPLVDFFNKFYLKTLDFFPFTSLEISILKSYDLIIFDNYSLEKIKYHDLKDILEKKSKNTEIVVVCNNEEDFNKIQKKFDLISQYSYSINKKGKENISCIYGNGKGKSTYSFGFTLRNLIDENYVKLVYFDKGGNFYGEKFFFDKLKFILNKFQYYSFGLERFDGKNFRFENNDDDFLESEFALTELHKSYDEHILVAEEINSCIGSGLLKEEEVISNLKDISNKILISGRCSSKKLLDLCLEKVEVKEIKHYAKKGFGVRKGIDF